MPTVLILGCQLLNICLVVTVVIYCGCTAVDPALPLPLRRDAAACLAVGTIAFVLLCSVFVGELLA